MKIFLATGLASMTFLAVRAQKRGLDKVPAVIRSVRGGADFAAVAHRSNRDTSATHGGDLGFMRRENLTPEVGAIAFALAPGQTSPHRTRASVGWFVVRVEERRQGPPPPYLTVKDELRNTLVREGMTAIAQAAVGEVTVHSFDIAGKDVQAEVGKHP